MKKVFLVSLIAFTSCGIQAQTQAGKTMIAKGKVAAELDQATRNLKRRSPIYDSERVVTGTNSKAQLRMTDGGMIALKENSELVIASYQYSGETGEGSVAMELLKGGLRSVTGAIKSESGDYNLKTPVGSIGIRGTHFEVEIVDGDMFLAVWDGAIDLTVETGNGLEDVVSFGEGEDFSFGIVTDDGEVTQLLEPPANFNQGHSDDNSEDDDSEDGDSEDGDSEDGDSEDGDSEDGDSEDGDSEDGDSEDGDSEDGDSEDGDSEDGDSEDGDSEGGDSEGGDSEGGDSEGGDSEGGNSSDSSNTQGSGDEGQQGTSGSSTGGTDAGGTTGGVDQGFTGTGGANDGTGAGDGATGADQDLSGSDNSFISGDEIDSIGSNSLEDIIAERTGVFTYGSVTDSSLSSSAGGASGLQMNMTIDFDTGAVPTGSLAFNDNGGEWFAAFSGFLIGADIDLDVTFASHGDNLADGDINAFFTNEADSISGNFSLFEINNPNITASGVYRIE